MTPPAHQILLKKYHEVLLAKNGNQDSARNDSFSIEGIDFTFYHEPEIAWDRLYIRCEVCDLEGEENKQFVARLLTDNFLRYRQRKPVFALCPDMIRVVALINLSLRETNAKTLDDIVFGLVKEVAQWRTLSLLKDQKTLSNESVVKHPPLWKMAHVKR